MKLLVVNGPLAGTWREEGPETVFFSSYPEPCRIGPGDSSELATITHRTAKYELYDLKSGLTKAFSVWVCVQEDV